jgi:hypothetical protein
MVENSNLAAPAGAIRRRVESLSAALDAAHEALAAGEHVGAERAAKAVTALARAAREVAALEAAAAAYPVQENIDDIRAELERRLTRYIEADRAEDLLARGDPGPGDVSP